MQILSNVNRFGLPIIFCFWVTSVQADQSSSLHDTFSLSSSVFGFSKVGRYSTWELGKSSALTYEHDNNLFQFRYADLIENIGSNPILVCSEIPLMRCDSVFYKEYGLLYGRRFSVKKSFLMASGGIGYLEFNPERALANYNNGASSFPRLASRSKDHTVGVALDVSYVLTAGAYFGFGPRFIANINEKSSIAAVLFELYVGRLK